MDLENKLIRVLEEYMKLLHAEIESMITIASIHGWESSTYKIELGEKLRNQIEEIKNEIGRIKRIGG